MDRRTPTAPQPPVPEADTGGKHTIRSADLLQGEREIIILHGNMPYRLRLTRQGKLILTK
ncbi:MAG: hemin uptake protein HemP [Ectothiorhodospiraceae bacterium]|nr:hemin uptake protein HemP [Ectothiorhodospiraceae bacterium]